MMRFRSFEFDSESRRLMRDGEDIRLTPKAFDLLSILIGEAPRVVSKAEIHARLWPDYAVADATLVGMIKEIRAALDDRDPDARIIRTVHRIGYAFDAAIESEVKLPPAHGVLAIGRRRARLTSGNVVIGRDPDCEVWIDDPTVSRRHARIVVSQGNAYVEDLGSKNGTMVSDQPVADRTALEDGDRIRFGGVEAVFRHAQSHRPTETQVQQPGRA